jgi:alkylation response protein AidB-like acyl-CoA dehydrogenase
MDIAATTEPPTGRTSEPDCLLTARAIADEVLFARTGAVDLGRADVRTGLDALAAAGLFGLHAPDSAGGLAAEADTAGRVVEVLAGGCLTTAFVWIQHQGAVKRLTGTGGDLADSWLPRLASGAVRAGVAVGGVRDEQDPLVATPTDTGWRLDGAIPWVTGWGLVDVLLVAAREGRDGPVVWLLVDAPDVRDPGGQLSSDDPTVCLQRVRVAACDHANSAVVALDGHPVPGDRLVTRQAHADWRAADATGLRTNGSLPLGVAARCARLADDDRLLGAIDDVRDRLDAATASELPRARAAAASLAWHTAEVLLVHTGGRGIGAGEHAQRLSREAMFLQVFGTRPSIRAAHLAALAG